MGKQRRTFTVFSTCNIGFVYFTPIANFHLFQGADAAQAQTQRTAPRAPLSTAAPPPAAAQPHPAAPSSARASVARPSDRAALVPRRKMPPARLRRDGAAAPIRGGGRSYPRCRCPAGALLLAGPAPRRARRPVEPSPSERPPGPGAALPGGREHGAATGAAAGGSRPAGGERRVRGAGPRGRGQSAAERSRSWGRGASGRPALAAGLRLRKICDVRNLTSLSQVFRLSFFRFRNLEIVFLN